MNEAIGSMCYYKVSSCIMQSRISILVRSRNTYVICGITSLCTICRHHHNYINLPYKCIFSYVSSLQFPMTALLSQYLTEVLWSIVSLSLSNELNSESKFMSWLLLFVLFDLYFFINMTDTKSTKRKSKTELPVMMNTG